MPRYIISRTDSIGDVVLTLPVAGMIKKTVPGSEILFLGRKYTQPIIERCIHIDHFIDWDEIKMLDARDQVDRIRSLQADSFLHIFPHKEIALLAKKSRVPVRLGTTNRLYHWYTCNRLIPLGRKRSHLHEAQLNLKLVSGVTGVKRDVKKEEIISLYGLTAGGNLPAGLGKHLAKDRINLVLHPKSKGSAREWGTDNFRSLVALLPEEKYNIIVTGTGEEGKLLEAEAFFDLGREVINLTGALDLGQLIAFISRSDALVAASTGPLHIAAALGINAIGLYPPIKPMHPGRWAPLGVNADFLVYEKNCTECRKSRICRCMKEISPVLVYDKLERIKITR